jgi:hypothetical protein
MDFIKGGAGKPKRPTKAAPKVKQVTARPVDESELPSKIEVTQKGTVASIVPGSVWRQSAFKWDPKPFATMSDELNEKFIEPSVQDSSLVRFIKKPHQPMIYGVAGNPDDSKAKLFAAYLVDIHCKRLKGDANPWWINLVGGFDNQWLDPQRPRPSMIVLTNLTPQSTNQKLEKARDILETYPDVPRIVVVAGADPLSFLATRLHVAVHGLAYFCEALVKQKIEVI